MLVLPHHRAFEAGHHIHPGRELRLHREGGVGAVLAAAVGDGIVDHHDLAVVAHVDAPLERAQQRVADGQGPGEPHARRCHVAPQGRVDERAGAEIVRHGPADDAASRRALQRLHHGAPAGVVEPDVEEHMDARAGGIDVLDHGGDGGGGIRQQLGPVSPHRQEMVHRLADAEQRDVALRDIRFRRRTGDALGRRQLRHRGAQLLHRLSPEVHLAEQDVGDDAHHRRQRDHQHPGHARGGLAVRPEQGADDEDDLKAQMGGEQRPGDHGGLIHVCGTPGERSTAVLKHFPAKWIPARLKNMRIGQSRHRRRQRERLTRRRRARAGCRPWRAVG